MMRLTGVILTLGILSLSCSDDQPTSPGSPAYPAPEFLFVTFGHELATVENEAIHFEAYPSQSSVSSTYVGGPEKLVLEFAEQKAGSNDFTSDKTQIRLRLTTRYDHEDLQGGTNLQFRGSGLGKGDGVWLSTFSVRIPTRIASPAVAGNDILDFSSTENDFLIVSYESPTSHRTLVDTLIITKSN
jgi:hypothetical protein